MRSRRIPECGHCGAGDRERESAFQKKGGKIIEKRYGVGHKQASGVMGGTEGGKGTIERERERERKGREGIEDSEGGTHGPIEGGVRVGGVGERKLDWERSTRPSERFEFPWEKKGGGSERRWAWKISRSRSQVARASAKAKTERMASKRRSVTVTLCYGLNRKREAQDEATRIGTKPSGVMTR